jgi:hypothetical protein
MTAADKLTLAITDYLTNNRATGLPAAASFPIRAATNDSPQDVPGAGVMAGETEEMVPLRETYKIPLTVSLRAEAKDTVASTLRDYGGLIAGKMVDRTAVKAWVNKPGGTDSRAWAQFHLYDIFYKDGMSRQDGVDFIIDLKFEAVCTGHDVA